MYYKDLEVWKKSIELSIKIYKITENFPKNEMYGLTSQIRRCAVSIPSNIAEGCARYSDKDTLRFLEIAFGSLSEMDTQLIISDKLNYINYDEDLQKEVSQLNALIQGTKKFLQNQIK